MSGPKTIINYNLVVYKKYIDFDNDKQYFGKEEVKYAK